MVAHVKSSVIRDVQWKNEGILLYERETLAPLSNLFLPLHFTRLGRHGIHVVLSFLFSPFLKSRCREERLSCSSTETDPHLLGRCSMSAAGTWVKGSTGFCRESQPGPQPQTRTQDQRVLFGHSAKSHVNNKVVRHLSLLWIPVCVSSKEKGELSQDRIQKSFDALYSPKLQQKLLRT